MGNPGWWESQQNFLVVHRAFLYNSFLNIMSNHRITSEWCECLVGCQSKHLSLVCGLWFGLKYRSTWKKDANLHPEAISWYIAIFIQNIWEYTMLYSIYIHIVAHVTHGMCFATSVHVCIAVGVGDSWGHDTSPHWELEAQNWKWPWVPNCTCLNGMPLLSWVYLDILKPTDCKYYITICCIYVYIQYYDYYVELFEMGINVPYMEHPIITCFWRGPSKSIDMHSCKIS